MIEILWVILPPTVAVLLLVVVLHSRRVKGRRAVMASRGIPFLGHIMSLGETQLLDFVEDNYARHRSNFEANAMGKRMIFFSDWEIVKDILLRRPKSFRRDKSFEGWASDFGASKGLFNIEGSDWGRVRRLTSHSFSNQNLNAMTDKVIDMASAHILRLKANVKANSGNAAVPHNMLDEFAQFTLSVMLSLAFGSVVDIADYGPNMSADFQIVLRWVYRRYT